MATDYAIVETGGKQYRVEKGDSVLVDRLPDDEGAKVQLRAVMFRGADSVVLEPSELEKVKVEAKVAAHERGPKIQVFKYKAKKGYRRRQGHRSELTRLDVMDVKLLQRRPAKKKAAEDDAPPKASTAAKAEGKAASSPGKAATKTKESGKAKTAGKAKAAGRAKPAASGTGTRSKPKSGGAKAAGKGKTGGAKGKAAAEKGSAKPKSGGASAAKKRKTSSAKKED